ncbi:MAG: glycoside hydrolase family 3 protein [Gemmatimonadales bacterium]
MSIRRHLVIAFLVSLAPAVTLAQQPPARQRPVRVPGEVARLLRTLPLRDRIAQLVMPWIPGSYAAFDDSALAQVRAWVDSVRVGGIVVSIGSPLDIAAKLNFLQRRSRLPLLIASDLEAGTSIRFNGGTPFPTNMGVGASGSESDAFAMGRITAAEGRAAGIHLTFAPVADVNNNPANPIINTRAFGSDAREVARLVAAAVRGTETGGMLATAKHFPGHGDTDTDSHLALPVIRADWPRLDSLELVPFRSAIAAGVSVIMSAHVALPELTQGTTPATLDPAILTGVLRDSLGFTGLVVTDALNMGALVNSYGSGEAAVRALEAGTDILLMPLDPRSAVEAVEAAIRTGRLTRERIDTSLRRILLAKHRLGLFRRRTVDLDQLGFVVGRREHRDTALGVSRRAIVVVRDTLGILDSLRTGPRPVALVTYADAYSQPFGSTLSAELTKRGYSVRTFRLSATSGPEAYDSAAAVLGNSRLALFATSIRVAAWRGAIAMPERLADLIERSVRDRPTGLLSFGTPYLLAQVPKVPFYLLAWTGNPVMEEAVAGALTGAAITGRLPIDLPPGYPWGWGVPKDGRTAGRPDGR